jgi:hypothetical protein
LGGRPPIDVGEADDSQSGKGYRNKLTTAIYRNIPKTITQRTAGVGSLHESFDYELISGACFPSFDNLRGKFETAFIESFMTESVYLARIPFQPPIEIDATRTVLMLTTNKAELTRDCANRSSVTQIRKQPDTYMYQTFPEGDLLDHVRENQAQYLGAVFAIVREWYQCGKPQLPNAPHDFKRWACVLGWIVENILHEAPLLIDHRAIQTRLSSTGGNWLRDVALAVKAAGFDRQWMRSKQLLDVILESQIETPGISSDVDLDDEQFKKATLALGRRMAQCVKSDDMHVDGGMRVERQEGLDDEGRKRKLYRFTVAAGEDSQCSPISPNAPPIEMQCSPMSPIESEPF